MMVIGGCIAGTVILVGSLILPREKEKVAANPISTASPVAAQAEFAPDAKFGVVASKLAMQLSTLNSFGIGKGEFFLLINL